MKSKEIGLVVVRPLSIADGPQFSSCVLKITLPSACQEHTTAMGVIQESRHVWQEAASFRLSRSDDRLSVSAVAELSGKRVVLEGSCFLKKLITARFQEVCIPLFSGKVPFCELAAELEYYADNDSTRALSSDKATNELGEAEEEKNPLHRVLHLDREEKRTGAKEGVDHWPETGNANLSSGNTVHSASVDRVRKSVSSALTKALNKQILRTKMKFQV